MIQEPLLTIAIPTYNRLPYLKDLLPELIRQCQPYNEIEILVKDNDSVDGTWSYLCDMKRHNIRVDTNYSNVGGEENCIRCVEEARGEYVWIFPDDELLCPNGIATAISFLKEHRCDLILMGIGEGKDNWYGTYQEFIDESKPTTIINQAFLPSNIFRKRLFDTTVARDHSISIFDRNYGQFTLAYALAGNLFASGGSGWSGVDTVCQLNNAKVYHVRSKRAPPSVKLRYIRLKYIELLLYLGVPYPKIL